MTESLHFACTSCGKCCTDPPDMTVLEATRLGDVFVAALVYRLTSIPKDDNEAGMASLKPHQDFAGMASHEFVALLRESTAVRAAGATLTEPGWDHYISITARGWIYPPQNARQCPALAADGKLCTIHERRPLTCRTIPVRYDVPDRLLVRAFRGMVDRGKASADPYECDTSNAAPELLRDGELRDTAYIAARKDGIAAALAETELAGHILRSPHLPQLKELFPELRRAGVIGVSFHGALLAAHDLGLVDADKTRAFSEAQIALIEREIAAALVRRKREDRDTTTRFRHLLDAYRAVLARLTPKTI